MGGPGGLNQPNVSFSRGLSSQPLAFVTLSQIPYTGFGAGALLAGIYWIVLLIWSAVIAYVLLTRNVGSKIVNGLFDWVYARISAKKNESTIAEEIVEEFAPALPQQRIEREFKKATEIPEVVLPGMLAGPEEKKVSTDTLVLQTERNGTKTPWLELKRTIPQEVVVEKKDETPKRPEVLSFYQVSSGEEKQKTALPESELLRSIVRGETNLVLAALQGVRLEHKNIVEVLVGALCELDKVHCRRIGEQEVLKDEGLEDLFEQWTNKEIQRLIYILSTGIDQNHLSQDTSAKMALLRALEFAQEKKTTSIRTTAEIRYQSS